MDEDFYGKDVWEVISKNFSHVKGLYLDHAGSTLYSQTQLNNCITELGKNCFGNPHSRNAPSKLTSDLIDQTRVELLEFFQADPNEFTLIFTSGATDSLRLVAESFQFSNNKSSLSDKCGSFIYMKESHTSVIGMREYFKDHVPCYAIPSDEILSDLHPTKDFTSLPISTENEDQTSNTSDDQFKFTEASQNNSLFVFPAQCNFSGYKYPMELIAASQAGKFADITENLCINREVLNGRKYKHDSSAWFCLLDAASYVGTNQLNLSKWKPDFVAVSFYKIFGYPTGLGALIVHQRAYNILRKKYFGGGTVEYFSSSKNFHVARQSLHEKFENGTANFLSILSLRFGLRELKSLGLSMEKISVHTFGLGKLLYLSLSKLKHKNGNPLVEIYTHTDFSERQHQGAIITFNIRNETGDYVGYTHVEKVLAIYDIHVRTGCFCNPAACQYFLKLSDEDAKSNYLSGHKCGDENDMIDGRPTGAVRVSFGYMSTKREVIRFIDILSQNFIQGKSKYDGTKLDELHFPSCAPILLTSIHLYPIKSCGAFSPKNWSISKSGLLYDRNWVIVNEAGAALTQKREPKLCMIRPRIDLIARKLILEYHGTESTVSMDLDDCDVPSVDKVQLNYAKICGKVKRLIECESTVNQWLNDVLNQQGLKLLKIYNEEKKLMNNSSFLLLNYDSVLSLNKHFDSQDSEKASTTEERLTRFRGNFVVNGADAFEEDRWDKIKIGPLIFKNVGPCFRCQMICVDQNTSTRNPEALAVLAEFRGKQMPFGIHLEMDYTNSNEIASIQTDSPVYFDFFDDSLS